MQQTAEQRVQLALELARQARQAGQITAEQLSQFEREVGGQQPGTPVLINLEVQLPAGTRFPQNGQLNRAVADALQGAASQIGATVNRDSVQVIVSS